MVHLAAHRPDHGTQPSRLLLPSMLDGQPSPHRQSKSVGGIIVLQHCFGHRRIECLLRAGAQLSVPKRNITFSGYNNCPAVFSGQWIEAQAKIVAL